MGFWIWWLGQVRFGVLFIIFLVAVAFNTWLGLFVSSWYMLFPILTISVLLGLLGINWLLEKVIYPFRKYIQDEKERYKKTLK